MLINFHVNNEAKKYCVTFRIFIFINIIYIINLLILDQLLYYNFLYIKQKAIKYNK